MAETNQGKIQVVKNAPKWLKLTIDKFKHSLGRDDYFSRFIYYLFIIYFFDS